jgi:hypothetical protein
MARRQPQRTRGIGAGQLPAVAAVAIVAFIIHVAVLRLLDGDTPGAYGFGQIIGAHLASFLVTALIASLTRLGSIGATVAIYALTFGSIQMLLALTDLIPA